MRIAYLTTCSPARPASGHALRVHAHWRVMRRLGQVDVYAFDCRPPPAERLAARAEGILALAARRERGALLLARHARSFVHGRSMLYAKAVSPRRLARLTARLRADATDLLVIGDTWLADLLPLLRGAAKRIVVDTHNVESRLYARICAEQAWPGKLKYLLFRQNVGRLERQLAAADQVWAVSAADERTYRGEHGLREVAVLPNAIDVELYRPQPVPIERDTLVFTGSYGYWPNEAAALHLIGLSRRLSEGGVAHRALIVGRGPTAAMVEAARAAPAVTVTGPVDDVRGYIARAGLVVAPLTAGAGTKYKILEAMALGRPVVTTPVGAEGLDVRNEVEAFIAPDLRAFDARVEALLRAPDEVEAVGAAGRAWLMRTHSLAALERAMRGALHGLGLAPEPGERRERAA